MNNFSVKTTSSEWMATYPAEIMVCDQDGAIIEMNDVAVRMYEKEGGAKMIGTDVYDYHSEPARSNLRQLVEQRTHVIYTTEKGGMKKLVSIAPWYREGEYGGFALIVLELPQEMRNIVKD
jgi:transcriptional regulator with PAS, ATPase and Fis domain